MSRLAAAVLVGGESTRMGTPKAWLSWGSGLLLPDLVQRLNSVAYPVFVVARRGQDLPPFPGGRRLHDEVPAAAMGGITTALRASDRPLFVVGCDHPWLDPAFVASLLGVEGDAVIPDLDGMPQPLHALYRRSCLPALDEAIAAGRWALRKGWLDSLQIARPAGPWSEAERRSLVSANTPDEWARLSGEEPT
jgi:molybdopterin-guanine dinucleotide biosynthesis protein A